MDKQFTPTDYLAAVERILTPAQKDAIARDMALHEWQQRPGKPAGSTTARHTAFKYATRTVDKRGIYLSEDHFDIPPETIWHSGDIDAFEELMKLLKSGEPGIYARDVICDAVKKMDDQPNGLTQRWIAFGFMNMVSEAVGFFATHADWGTWLNQKRIEAAASQKRYEDGQREHMAMMTRKSAESRRAKKLAKVAA